MESLLNSKEKLVALYSKYDIYINSITKFLFALVMFFAISQTVGVDSIAGNPAVILIGALVCMFMPKIGIAYIMAFYSLVTVFSASLEFAVALAFVFVLVILLYMQFSPDYGYMVAVSAAACAFNLPVMLIILVGLLVGPAAIVPVVCGMMIYYIFSIVPAYLAELSGAYLETGVEKFKYIANHALLNKEMYLAMIAAVVVIMAVFIIKRLQVNHSWRLAILTGTVINLLIMSVGGIICNASVDVIRLIIGTIISLVLCFVVVFFVRNLDYKKIERVQFEDDEYYYYVKAIPKKTAEIKTPVKKRVVKENFDERDA